MDEPKGAACISGVSLRMSSSDLTARLALRPKEAAEALGISERKLRELLPELPHFRAGGAVVIPVKPLERWLEARVRQEAGRVDAAVETALKDLARED